MNGMGNVLKSYYTYTLRRENTSIKQLTSLMDWRAGFFFQILLMFTDLALTVFSIFVQNERTREKHVNTFNIWIEYLDPPAWGLNLCVSSLYMQVYTVKF